MGMTRRTFVIGSVSTCVLAAVGLVGCGGSSGGGRSGGSSEPADSFSDRATRSVSYDVSSDLSVSLEIPATWDSEIDDGGAWLNITPDDFDGAIQLGASVSPMSAFGSDQDLLSQWSSEDSTITDDWRQVGDGISPVYETATSLSAGSTTQGIVRVAICGDYAVSCYAYAYGDDWGNGAGDEIKTVISTFSVSNPVAPNYAGSGV
jgi:hypothetical protein